MVRPKEISKFRQLFAEKLMDLGNLIIAGFVIGQFAIGKEISIDFIAAGLFLWASCYILAYVITYF